MPDSKQKLADKQKRESFFEMFCQKLTSFIGSHWGTVFALCVFGFAVAILLIDSQSKTADVLEKILTMSSVVLLFFLQRSQNKDTLSLQIKLNELLASHEAADSKVIDAEHRSEEELEKLHDNMQKKINQKPFKI